MLATAARSVREGEDAHRFARGPASTPGVALEAATARRMADLFKVLADPARLRVMACLVGGEVCVHRLVETLGMSQPAVSHHLRVLRFMGLVSYRREGRHVFYRLDDRHVLDLFLQALSHASHSGSVT
ncbi:MAG: helix-turn-helix transcriptional regulator [Limnochordaceae bacterium]|nr:helix-turn-helix transcriptional regulator [Limnochordaceae bacterium]